MEVWRSQSIVRRMMESEQQRFQQQYVGGFFGSVFEMVLFQYRQRAFISALVDMNRRLARNKRRRLVSEFRNEMLSFTCTRSQIPRVWNPVEGIILIIIWPKMYFL